MSFEDSVALLQTLARRLRRDRNFMAHALATFQVHENLTDEELAEILGIPTELLVRLAICRRPSPSSSRFADELCELADYTLTDAARLANILRQVDAVESLSERTVTATSLDDAGTEAAGLLAAARDHVETSDEDASSTEQKKEPDD